MAAIDQIRHGGVGVPGDDDDDDGGGGGNFVCIGDPYYTCGPTGDPYWDNVILLLHGEGADGGTVFTDSSNYNRPMTLAGTPITTTEAKKFGASSIKLYGNLTAVITNLDASLYLADNDFTIEFWIYYDVAVGSFSRGAFQADSGSSPPWDITCLSSTNAINITLRNGGTQFATISTTALSVGQWYHIAFCRRNKTELYAFVNGVQAQYFTIGSTLISNNSSGIYVGNNRNNSDLAPRFYLDDIRITNGVARYTGNFNIPASAFPDYEDTSWDPTAPRTVLSIHADADPPTDFSCYQPKIVALTGVASIV